MKPIKTIAAILLFFISGIAIMISGIGNHGHLMFRPHMLQDWIIWGVAFTFFAIGILLLFKVKVKT